MSERELGDGCTHVVSPLAAAAPFEAWLRPSRFPSLAQRTTLSNLRLVQLNDRKRKRRETPRDGRPSPGSRAMSQCKCNEGKEEAARSQKASVLELRDNAHVLGVILDLQQPISALADMMQACANGPKSSAGRPTRGGTGPAAR